MMPNERGMVEENASENEILRYPTPADKGPRAGDLATSDPNSRVLTTFFVEMFNTKSVFLRL